MSRLVMVPARVPVRRGVAASDMSARETQAQMYPVLPGLDTIFAEVLICLQYMRFTEMGTRRAQAGLQGCL